MVSLIAKTPLQGLLPLDIEDVRATEVADQGPIFHVQPLNGARPPDIEASLGFAMPEPGQVVANSSTRAFWCGPNQALVFGNVAPSAGLAVIDQSDAWAMARVEGVGARDVLARLTPLDLRPSTFAAGQTARTMIGHMTGQVTALGPETYELMVFRSMAGTLVHDLKRAMGFVAGRSKLG